MGDRVCLPFNIGCGFCKNCEKGLTRLLPDRQSRHGGRGVRLCRHGPYSGGQAEYLRVPFGDFNCLLLPPDAEEKENDYVMLSDIFPTGYHATELAGVEPGDSVVIYGAGPVGLMAALSASSRARARSWSSTRHPDRLKLAEKMGAIPIDDSEGNGVERVLEMTGGEGADRGCECVGYQCSCKGTKCRT